MAYSIVRFTAEEGAPGIVSSSWITKERNICFFPNVSTEEKKNKLLLSRAPPEKNWLQCPIKILKEFSTYQAARNKLTEAENTSNIDSDAELSRPRKRKRKQIHLPGETSSSEEEFSYKISNEKKTKILLPLPPVPPCLRDSVEKESESLLSPVPEEHVTLNEENIDIKRIMANQATMWSVITDLMTTMKSNAEKLDRILEKLDSLSNKNECTATTGIDMLTLLPVGIDDFVKLNEELCESAPLRQNLVRILMTSGGRDAKGMVASMLRKVITDDIGEKFSLTGKQQKCSLPKEAFEKTALYKLIIQACCKVHPQTKENVIRESISDWLMQSKFRKMRKEKRKNPNEIFINDSTLDFD